MTKEQVGLLVDVVIGNWNLKLIPSQKIPMTKAWERYLSDMDYTEVSHAVDARAMAGGFPPKPAEIRLDVLKAKGQAPPGAVEALAQAKKLTDAVQFGITLPLNTHDLVRETIREIGVQHDVAFKERYEEKLLEYFSRLLPPNLS